MPTFNFMRKYTGRIHVSTQCLHRRHCRRNRINISLTHFCVSVCLCRCHCEPGWLGIHCTKRTADCAQSSAYEMCGHGVCVHSHDPKTYECICDQGWTTNGTTPACTVDINECESEKPHCSKDPEVPCVNLPGLYACGQCPHGVISFIYLYSQLTSQ